MTETILKELFLLSRRAIESAAITQCWCGEVGPTYLGQELYRLALSARGVEAIPDCDILPTFFTEEAIKTLQTMPNKFWFWKIVHESTLSHVPATGMGSGSTIGVEAVKRAIAQERRGFQRIRNLNVDEKSLPPEEAAYWLASGVLLVEVVNDKITVVRNPIFSKSASA